MTVQKEIKKNFISVVVPVCKQEKTIKEDLTHIDQVLAKTRFSYEIIAVVDGKTIDNSYHEAKKIKLPSLKVVGYQDNRGKGYAVRFGMAQSRGDKIAFIDAGMDIDPNGISMILEHMEWYEADIIVGSKRHPASQVEYPPWRKIYSLGYQFLTRVLFGLKIRDTQAGLKIFKREVLEKVLPRLLVKRFAFDVELLSVANYLGFRKIYEAPIKLNRERFDFSSTIKFKTIFEMLLDTMAVFYRLRILRYYRDGNQRKWQYDKNLDFKINIG
ncbi:glycosyltransferase family 2 protein [Candidatus Shapirobacteria bacterium CG10_big_fil_rev_8_21_14_0_10_38_14]|uniref:Glycosyltransferase family 2 protein n=1 Tax=Candidatus Shapirobacteria bacterium CG10_big_fil_rev_8_21_14_0_10_38_14 TaxID=1974483 RepID=A0A2M8L684_9BACT|nr:MAG: glycosyltransferase family 2 protein [Candidatus Shapirobacteria bacterium CG10_big_fil_rev_8_21_14_0_10_38_14]